MLQGGTMGLLARFKKKEVHEEKIDN